MRRQTRPQGEAMRGRVTMMVLVLGTVLGAGPALAQDSCPEFGAEDQLPVLLNPKLAPRTVLLCNRGYAVLHSGLAHEPLWAAEYLTRQDVEAAKRIGRSTNNFHEETRLPAGDGARLADYRGSGYDRGHQVPSGDASSLEAQEETFSLSNIVPQTPRLNQGIWAGVEMGVRALARRDGALYVVTGPLFEGQIQAIGQEVLVPSASWKAVYDPERNGAGAYVCTNTQAPSCKQMSVAALEARIGIDPFPGIAQSVKDRAMPLPEAMASPYGERGRSEDQMEARLLRQLQKTLIREGWKVLRHVMENAQ
ncbi:DNA/RNA non-specific endonuclease [Acetobacter vaccinii]|uniref:Endonuclease n=1 Tax=Acetobacter vaccinii TaxID=2592655 RepID=A0A5C1YSK3_9PROT|nr:DNA/RNA non-specific endonuclease [Acetobacter vaccinii]QEO18793.1 DNA/RNA non-specific endonuclease [Acetobacter vaccinii]